ncbi:putative fatty acyl-CoA reductase CG5065 [Chrysoperla carnea]|uniref:putative fatty acyl-CoA reductase CG5065 n=1 Tax=Chrysoperla carnea TaxID=189513 RepID=UPI001D08591F|nr:putative fatty acyl-CoA reductase CG5065 [Chrysoperla carnea]
MVTSKNQSYSPIKIQKKDNHIEYLNNNNNREEVLNLNSYTRVGDFYQHAVLFITGSTGFVGKALVEKLLRSCEGIQTIYVLIRPKRGLLVDQRLKELLKNPVFDRIRTKNPEYFNKIKAVSGDVTQKDLGLSATDKKIITSSVTVAFHSAATVRFNESLKDAIILNTLGTQRVVELCREMVNLKSFVHVSTAYSNADKREIQETVYTPVHDPRVILECIESLPNDVVSVISEKIKGKHPNTYTLTKAMAEHIVMEKTGDIPAAIVRPSIVTAAWKEPFPGWIDNISGITGIMMEIGRGTIRSIICDETLTMDLIPVDIVVNTIITAAWQTAFNRSNTMRVYNCTSGQLNGVSWAEFGEMTKKYAIMNPTKYVTFYPGFTYRTNRIVHKFCEIFCHMIPAFVLDILLRVQGGKPIMLKIAKKFKAAAKTGEFFALNEWHFHTKNIKSLIYDLRTHTSDHEEFECDITNGFEWDPYVKSYMLGIRKYVLKDDIDSLPNARKRLQRLYWAHKVTQVLSVYFFLRFIFLR